MVGPKSNAETSEIVPSVRAKVVPGVWAKVVWRGKVAAGEVRWVNCEFRMPIPMGRGEESAWGGCGLLIFPCGVMTGVEGLPFDAS